MFKFDALFCNIKLCSDKKRQLSNSRWQFHNNSADCQIFTDRFVSLRRIFLTQNQIVNQPKTMPTFSLVRVSSWSAAICESVNCAGVSELFSSLLMLLFVHHLFENLFINAIALYPFNWYKFLIKILLYSSLNIMFTNTVTSAVTKSVDV